MNRLSYPYPDARILIFSKAPVAGKAKTRLISQLGETGAAEFSARLTRYTVERAVHSQLCPVELYCDGALDHPLFCELHARHGISLKSQQGVDLGTRMTHALAEGLANCQQVLLIGSDCPAITGDYLEQALQMLTGTASCVLGPAEDGGYVLVGQSRLNTDMFKNINWGTSTVLQQTRQRLSEAGLICSELDTLWDVDRVEDIAAANEVMSAKEGGFI